METATEKQQQEKTYFSRSSGLVIAIGGEVKWVNDKRQKIGEKHAIFGDMGDGFGRLKTDDPDIIAALDKRMELLGDRSDVLTPQQYAIAVLSPAQYIAQLQQESRELQSQNALLQKLAKDKKQQ